MKLRGLALLGILLIGGLVTGQDPAKHPRYEEFRKAPLVLLAKLEAASVTAVQESFPPRYIFAASLRPTEVLRGGFEKGKQVKCSHGVISIDEPKLPIGKEVLVQLQMRDRLSASN